MGGDDSNGILCDRTFIDDAVGLGYTLHFFKLSNNQVLSTICCAGGSGNYISVKSVITDDIKNCFELLNKTLQVFGFDRTYDFVNFLSSQTALVYAYQKNWFKRENRF